MHVLRHIVFLIFTSLIFAGCSARLATRYQDCSTLMITDSTTLLVDGLMDHNELDVSWIQYSIPRSEFKAWLLEHSKDLLRDISTLRDSTKLTQDFINWVEETDRHIQTVAKPTDQILYFSTPESWWKGLGGQDGIIVLRRCSIILQIILAQS